VIPDIDFMIRMWLIFFVYGGVQDFMHVFFPCAWACLYYLTYSPYDAIQCR